MKLLHRKAFGDFAKGPRNIEIGPGNKVQSDLFDRALQTFFLIQKKVYPPCEIGFGEFIKANSKNKKNLLMKVGLLYQGTTIFRQGACK